MIAELSRFYLSKGIEPVILTKKWPIDIPDEAIYQGVRIYRIKSARTESEFDDVISWLKLNEEKIKADIIHVIGVRRPMPLVGLLLSKLWKVPLICTVAGGDIPDRVDPYPGTIWQESKETVYPTLIKSDVITCVSKDIEEDFKYFFPEIKTPTETIYAGIDIKLINNTPAQTEVSGDYIFSLRRLDPTKGIHILIEAFSYLIKDFPKLTLIIAGDGSEKNKLVELVRKLNLDDKVKFIGTISLESGIAFLKRAKLTVVPSLSEAGGLINVEAQAAGCPVVATRVGGIPEYVSDGVSGILCEPGNPKALADAISLVLKDEKLRNRLIDEGISYSKKFDWEVLTPQYLSLYARVLKEFDVNKLSDDTFFNNLWNKFKN